MYAFSPHSKAIEFSNECWEYVCVCACSVPTVYRVYVSHCVRRHTYTHSHTLHFFENVFFSFYSENMISRAQTYCHAPVQMCCELQFMVDDNAMWRRNKQIYLHLFNGSIYKPHFVQLSRWCFSCSLHFASCTFSNPLLFVFNTFVMTLPYMNEKEKVN